MGSTPKIPRAPRWAAGVLDLEAEAHGARGPVVHCGRSLASQLGPGREGGRSASGGQKKQHQGPPGWLANLPLPKQPPP